MMRGTWKALGLSLLLLCAPGTHAEDDEDEIAPMVRDEASLRLILATPAPPGAAPARLDAYYKDKYGAALQLGQYGLALEIARAWYDAMPPQRRLVPLYQLHALNIKHGDRDLGLNYGEELVRIDQSWSGRFRTRLGLAGIYLDQYQVRRARALTQEGARFLDDTSDRGKGAKGQFHLERGHSVLALLRSRFARLDGKYDEAVRLALDSVEHAKRAAGLARGFERRLQHAAYGQYAASIGAAVKAFRAESRYFEAEALLFEAVEYLRRENWLAAHYPMLVRNAAGLRMDQQRFADALVLARRSARACEQAGGDLGSSFVWSEQLRLAALMGLNRWDEAAQGYRDLEQRLKGHPALVRLLSGVQRGTAQLMAGDYEAAGRVLDAAYRKRSDLFGPDHVFTAQALALYGIALWRKAQRSADAYGLSEGKRLMARGAHRVLAADGQSGAANVAALGPVYRRIVLEAYLDALYPAMNSGDEAAIDEGFRISDALRGSSVQDAIVGAAVRAAAGVPKLSELIRTVQDSEREMLSLYEYLVDQSGATLVDFDAEGIAQLRGRLDALETTRREALEQVRRGFPDFDALTRPAAPGSQEVAGRIAAGEALLSLLPTAQRTYLWLVTDRGVSFAASEHGEARIRDWVGALRRSLDVAGLPAPPPVDAQAAHQLYRALVEPLRERAGGRREWIVAAGGVLGQLPFAALLTRPDGAADAARAPWLVRELALSGVPSAASWIALRRRPPTQRTKASLVAFGDPLFGAGGAAGAAATSLDIRRAASLADELADGAMPPLPDPRATHAIAIPALPETRGEILAVARALAADPRRDVFFGADASRRTVLQLSASQELARRRVVMFATHGLIPGDLPDLTQPALALARGGNQDWLLTLADVLTLKLDADWVVLSACNTAAADGRSGEALSGLGRGFFYAGARAVLVTHWAVETQSARDLTAGMFAAYGAGRTSRAEALRMAQAALAAKPKTAHPTYWAAYALVGDGAR